MSADAFGTHLVIFGVIFVVITLLLFIGSLFWAYHDAEARGKTGCLWALIIFFTWPVGFLAYVVLRDEQVKL